MGAFQDLKKKTKSMPLSKYRYLATILEGHPLPFSTPYDFWWFYGFQEELLPLYDDFDDGFERQVVEEMLEVDLEETAELLPLYDDFERALDDGFERQVVEEMLEVDLQVAGQINYLYFSL